MTRSVADTKVTEEKRQLREMIRRELSRISSAENQRASDAVLARVLESERFDRSRVVAFYWAMGWEIDLRKLLGGGSFAGRGFALPRWSPEGANYEFARVHSVDDLSPGRFGIEEPNAVCELVGRGEIDLVFVPGLAFSRRGGRLGRGRGFYDRLLCGLAADFCGVCHEVQLKDTLPTHAWDQIMNYIVTPKQWFATGDN